MEVRTLCVAFVCAFIFYHRIIRRRRCVAFFARFVCFFIMLIPTIALLNGLHSEPRIAQDASTKEAAIDVSTYILQHSILFGIWVCFVVDLQSSWKDILFKTFLWFIGIHVALVYAFWKMGTTITQEHISFLRHSAPSIIGRFVVRLPFYNWADEWWFLKSVAHYLLYSKPINSSLSIKGNSTANFTTIQEL